MDVRNTVPAQQPPWADSYAPGVPLHLDYGDTTVLDSYDNGTQARRIHFEQGRRAWVEAYDKYGRVVNTTRL